MQRSLATMCVGIAPLRCERSASAAAWPNVFRKMLLPRRNSRSAAEPTTCRRQFARGMVTTHMAKTWSCSVLVADGVGFSDLPSKACSAGRSSCTVGLIFRTCEFDRHVSDPTQDKTLLIRIMQQGRGGSLRIRIIEENGHLLR